MPKASGRTPRTRSQRSNTTSALRHGHRTSRNQPGRRMERVRVVSEPHSDHTRFGLALAAHNTAAGEDIRYLPRNRAAGLDPPGDDFWLIDSTTPLILRFGDDDIPLGADLVTDPSVVVRHCYDRDVARHYATPWSEYKNRVRLPEGPRSSWASPA